MKNNLQFDRRQLFALSTVMLLTPALRVYPSATAELSGKAAWLCMPAALPLVLLYMFFLSRFMDRRNEQEGLGELTLRALGSCMGRIVLVVFALWMLLYVGFVLRSGADRLITTIYPHSPPYVFSIIMGILALIAALCSPKSIVRSAKLILPPVLGILILILFFSLFSVHSQNLLPVTVYDIAPVIKGSVLTVNVFLGAIYIVCFFEGMTKKRASCFKNSIFWLIGISLILFLLAFDIIGSFGAELTAQLTRPFFTLVRNLVFFRSLERIEALVVTLWIFPDFILSSVFLYTAQHCIRLAVGNDSSYRAERLTDFTNGRWIIWLCATASIVCSIIIAPTPTSLHFWSYKLIPAFNLSVAFILIPFIYIYGRIRKKL